MARPAIDGSTAMITKPIYPKSVYVCLTRMTSLCAHVQEGTAEKQFCFAFCALLFSQVTCGICANVRLQNVSTE